MTIDQFTRVNAPVTVIVNIANPLALKLARILLEQGSRLLLVDRMTSEKKKLLGDLLEQENCLFMDAESTFRNISKFKKIDYVYYFLQHMVSGSTYPVHNAERMDMVPIQHKEFIRESNRVDAYMKLGAEFDATVTLITSAYVAQYLEHLPEANLQLQRYAESLVLEYVERNRLNARIVRVGELIGEEYDVAAPTNLARLIREVLLRSKVNIFGDGLQQNYIVPTEDAVYAILKAAFSDNTKGRTYLASYVHPLTSLSLAYQLLELTADEKEVVFNEVLPRHDDIAKLKDMCLAPSATGLGWEPHIPLDQALSDTMIGLAKELRQPWQQVPKAIQPVVATASGSQEMPEEPTKGKKKQKLPKISTNLQWNRVDFAISRFYQKFIAGPILSLFAVPQNVSASISQASGAAKEKIVSWSVALIVGLLVLVTTTPYIHFAITSYKLYVLAKGIKTDVAALEPSRLTTYANQLPELTDSLLTDYLQVSYLATVPYIGEQYQELGGVLEAGSLYAKSAYAALTASAPALEIVKGLADVSPNNPAGQSSHDYYTQIDSMIKQRSGIVQAAQDAVIAAQRLSKVQASVFPAPIQSGLEMAKTQLSGYTKTLDETAKFYDLIPYLLGYKDRRTYLLMMQNETELRATGGWFSNYALVGIENGKVRELTVNDVYELDGRIAGKASPVDMQKALDVKNYKLSLSNWNPEMSVVSSDAAAMFAQSGVYKPNDVTISMTFQVVKKLLAAVGSVKVDSFGEITAENMYEKIGILHSEFVPGSQEKTKVVSQFLPKLLDAIAQAPLEKKRDAINVLLSAVTHRNIMIYANDSVLRTRLLDAFDTYLVLKPVQNPVFAVDWNWGGNKANKFLTRVTDIEINEATGKAKMTMTYTNQSKSDAYPEGKYVNAQRIYFPEQWTLQGITGYDTPATTYKTEQMVPYFLANMHVNKQSSAAVSSTFAMKSIPPTLSLFKQSGVDVEIVRVAVIPKVIKSGISTDVLESQEFTLKDGKWVKTYVRNGDIQVKLRN